MNAADPFGPPPSFLNYYGQEDQLFQRPLLHTLGQNYLPNTRPPLQLSANYPPPPNPFIEYQRTRQPVQEERSVNQETFFTDHAEDHDSKRQAVWNELQRTSAKVHEKNSKKQESPTRNRAPFGSTLTWNGSGSQQSFAQRPPPRPTYHEENSKENSFQRSPLRKHEKPKEPEQDSRVQFQQNSIPVTLNLNSPNGSLPRTVTIPVDSQVNRNGDKISVNIDLRLVDLDNAQQQQQQQTVNHPQWSGGDPLDLHIRKLERNIEQTLPTNNNSRQRNPVAPSTAVNPLFGRYANKQTSGGRAGYVPPSHGVEFYNPNDKNRDEDSYLAKLNQNKRSPHFKPYTGRDYEQFKKNYGFGTGHMGFAFENTTRKEKLEQTARTRQYAQQIEARNKKKISEASRRTLSDTRLPKSTRLIHEVRPKQLSGKTTFSSPSILSHGHVSFIPAGRPTDILYRPPFSTSPRPSLPPIRRPLKFYPSDDEQI